MRKPRSLCDSLFRSDVVDAKVDARRQVEEGAQHARTDRALVLAVLSCLQAFAVTACNSSDYCIDDTCVVLLEDAAPWNDLGTYLPHMRAVTADRYGSTVAEEAFSVDLELFPSEHTLMLRTTQGEIRVECGALWERPVIQATVVGERTVDGCLPHEFWQHRLPHALGFGWNDDHSEYWRAIDADLQTTVQEESEEPTTQALHLQAGTSNATGDVRNVTHATSLLMQAERGSGYEP